MNIEFIRETQLTIPLEHMILFIMLIACCLLFGRHKTGLAITFSFTFYWGFIYNREIIFSNFDGSPSFLFLYYFSGFLILLFTLCSLVAED